MLKLHGYYRSTASWRVRIAIALKGVDVTHVSYNLREKKHLEAGYLEINPQGLVPALQIEGGGVLTQSIAIIEWLDEMSSERTLLSDNVFIRAQQRAFALVIGADIHPVQNLRVLNALRELQLDEEKVISWAAGVIDKGLEACEKLISDQNDSFCFGINPSLADICLVPQLGNARRFGVDVSRFPRLLEKEAACNDLEAFSSSVPDRQFDAEK